MSDQSMTLLHWSKSPATITRSIAVLLCHHYSFPPPPSSLFTLTIPKSQMNPTTPSFILLVFSVLIRTTLCHLNPNFQACEPKTCGNGQNITYPFYIRNQQDRLCGFRRFDLVCASDGFPMLNLSNTLYIVDEIFYHNYSLRVSNPNFPISNSTNCLAPSYNFSLDYRFSLVPNQKHVQLFFDCELPSLPEEMKEDVVGCYVGERTRSVLGVAEEGEEKKMKYAKDNCRGGMMTTVVENMEGGMREALGRGFLLKPVNWTENMPEKRREVWFRRHICVWLQVSLPRP